MDRRPGMRPQLLVAGNAMYSLRLFGGVTLTGAGGPVTGRAAQRRRLALLALLGTSRSRGLGRERFIGYLWPETDPDRARHLLADSLYVLRKELGEECVLASGDLLRLNPSVIESDVASFEEALEAGRPRAAVELYAGPFLDGFYIDGAPDFEKWTDRERRRLASRYAEALETLARRAEEGGRQRESVRWWRELARHDPYDTRAAERLALALAAAGNRAAALRHARRHRKALRDELGIGPSDALEGLIDRLERGVPPPERGEPGGVRAERGEPGGVRAERGGPAPEPGEGAARREREERPGGGAARAELAPPHDDRLAAASLRGEPERRSRARPRTVAAISASFLALAVALWWAVPADRADEAEAGIAARILVLPFDGIGGLEARYLADGITGEIRSRLGRIPSLAVISRTTSLHYGRAGKTVSQIGSELSVDYVLEGIVRREPRSDGDPAIRFTPQLVRVADDRNVWSRSYEFEQAEVLDLEAHVAGLVTSALELELLEAEQRMLAARPTGDVDAYYLYLEARSLRNAPEGDLHEARRLFERATTLDSGFAAAWAGLAETYTELAWISTTGMDEARGLLEMARAAARRAMDLDPTRAEGHAVLASILMLEPDWHGAEREIRRAIDLNPSDAKSRLAYALLLSALGRRDESAWQLERARSLDPLSVTVNRYHLAGLLFVQRDYEAFIHEARRFEETGLVQPGALDADLASAYLRSGQPDSARVLLYPTIGLDPAVPLPSDASALVDSVLSGNWIRPARRLRMLSELEDRPDILWAMIDRLRRDYLTSADPARQQPHDIAIAFGHLGEADSAFAWIEKVRWDVPRVNNLRWTGWSDTLQSDPRYAALLRRIGVPP